MQNKNMSFAASVCALDGTSTAEPKPAPINSRNRRGRIFGLRGSLLMLALAFGGVCGTGTAQAQAPVNELNILHSFTQGDGAVGPLPNYAEGALAQDKVGIMYGVTPHGGPGGMGTIFKVTRTGLFATIHYFAYNSKTGAGSENGLQPNGTLHAGMDGNFYGTTVAGGANQHGTVFQIMPTGGFTVLYSFQGTDGASPIGSLAQGPDGSLYGTTAAGGTGSTGVVFKLAPDSQGRFVVQGQPVGTYSVLHNFAKIASTITMTNSDGALPCGGLAMDKNGNFCGTTLYGGQNGTGTIFGMTSSGAFVSLYSFTPATGAPGAKVNSDGANPEAGLHPGKNGGVYGVATNGGAFGNGTLFQVLPDPNGNWLNNNGGFAGSVNIIYTFSAYNPNLTGNVNIDGANPTGGLLQIGDGSLYGTTRNGGEAGMGCLFHLIPDAQGRFVVQGQPVGTFAVVHNCIGQPANPTVCDLAHPTARLIQGMDGNLYGMALGGATGAGSIFQLQIAPTLSGAFPMQGSVGSTITLLGNRLSGVTAVWFGTVQATQFTVSADNRIMVTVPVGATTGPISVNSPIGNATTTMPFLINTP